jgi:plastocyanin
MMIKGLFAAVMVWFSVGGAPTSGSRIEFPPRERVLPQEQAGTIAGKIELRSATQVIRRERGGRYQATGSMSDMNEREVKQSEQHNVVVYLEGGTLEMAGLQNSSHGAIDQMQAVFIPHVLAVQKGAVVDFVNHDKTYHNVFSLSPAKRFNIGRRPAGEKVPVLFDKPGIVQVFCDIHSQMSAFVVVIDNPYFVQPDDDGTFRIEHVPQGNTQGLARAARRSGTEDHGQRRDCGKSYRRP